MKNFKTIVASLFALIAMFIIFSSNNGSNTKTGDKKPVISVSTFALYDIVNHIAEDKVKVINILPFGVDPHSFEPTPKLMAAIEDSSVVFYSGAGLEPWVHTTSFKNKAIDMSKYVKLRELGKSEFEFHKHHDEQCAHSTTDPHYWLSFSNMKIMVEVVTKELERLSPRDKTFFEENKNKYIAMLDKLDNAYKTKLSQCRVDTVILNHNAIGYMAKRYGFNVESLSGLAPEADPTASDMKRVMKDIKDRGIEIVFFENFANSKTMKTIAKDMGVALDTLQPLGNITADEANKHLTYEDIMYRNLEKLSKALVCR